MTDGITEALGGTRIVCKHEGFTLIIRVGSWDDAREQAARTARRLKAKCTVVG